MKKTIHDNTPDKATESFLQNMRHVALAEREAREMRERLVAYSDLHTVSMLEKAPAGRRVISAFSFQFFSSSRLLIASALILVLLVSGTGVTYAAENTLPGQILYPVKVAVIEPIQGALITSTAGKAQWQNELADRRLTEAATLAAQNKLGTSTQQYLQQAVAQHVALSQKETTLLADSGNQEAALNVRSDLEARLSAHADFLALITPRLASNDDSTTTAAVVALLQGVEQYRSQVELSREAAEAALASTTVVAIADKSANPGDKDDHVYGANIALQENTAPTPSQSKAIAYVEAEDAGRKAEETTLFRKSAALFRLVPFGTTTASTTASTTIWITNKDASSSDATSSFKLLIEQSQTQTLEPAPELPEEKLSAPH